MFICDQTNLDSQKSVGPSSEITDSISNKNFVIKTSKSELDNKHPQ